MMGELPLIEDLPAPTDDQNGRLLPVLQKATHDDPEQRYQSIPEFLQALPN